MCPVSRPVPQRHKIVKKFDKAIEAGKSQLEIDISQRLNGKLSIIYDELERECSKFYQDVEQEEQEILPLLELSSIIQTDSNQLFSKTSELLM
ncbi:hypothetical protein [Acaryochloris sp. CCMEE 5410]|uniref:hypothetical protein n=1 Tax=Acaryochloris sp. CCMEE 5410 TaxID=310037 RepID=UPI0021CE73B1|nr:hypothetical protein [Acaryochloris sp. CCMEE 5410]